MGMRFLNVHLLMLLCATLVSGSFPVGEAISGDLDPAVLTLVRFGLASVLFAPLIQYRYGLGVSPGALFRYALVSACLVIFFWCMFYSLRFTTALNTSAIFTLVPSLAGVYAMFLNRERLGRSRLIALFLGLVGALWVIFKGDMDLFLTLSWNRGDLIFFIGCLFMGLYTPLVRLLHRGEPMLQMAFWIMVTGSLWLLLIGGPKLAVVAWSEVPARAWYGIVYLAVFSTIVTFFLTQYSILFLGPTRVMAYSYLYPGLVLVIDLLCGKPWPGFGILPGIIIVLSAMVVVQTMEQA
ncbi:MAG: DMT family transporter [Thermodesulfobacteriota bacterium]